MKRSAKLLWGAFAAICAMAVGLWLSACGGAQEPAPRRVQVISCLDAANALLQEAHSCQEARAVVARVVADAPQCASLFGLHLNLDGDAGDALRCDD